MDESFHQFSFGLILDGDLRTLDSLQLSAALSLAEGETAPTFVCADGALCDVAGGRGLDTVNPLD